MRNRYLLTAPLFMVAAGISQCQSPVEMIACPSIGWIPIVAEVRDQDGRPAANGAIVTIIRADGYAASARGTGHDELHVRVGDPVTGVFDVTVTKPYHQGSTVHGVQVKGDPQCGVPKAPGTARLTVSLIDGAPAVRQVVVPQMAYGFGDGNVTAQIPAFVEAAEGVSRHAEWVSRDTAVARITPTGVVTSACRTSYASTWVVASVAADPTVRDSVAVHVSAAPSNSTRCP
jgi:hypothetical protein